MRTMSETKILELYFFESCPFCQKVLRVINELNIKIDLLNIRENPDHAEKLVQDTGRRTVPCLYIDGAPMHESDDINNWLRENVNHLNKRS